MVLIDEEKLVNILNDMDALFNEHELDYDEIFYVLDVLSKANNLARDEQYRECYQDGMMELLRKEALR